MKTVNLIPAPRRDARRRRTQRTVCAATCGAYALLLGCAVGVAHLAWPGGGESVEARLGAVDKDIARLEADAAAARTELAVARATVEANRTVAEQPDWSVLLTLLAQTTGDDVVLRSISVAPPLPTASAPKPGPAASAANPGAPEVVLEVAGIGRTPLSVSRHVLKLEETGLFAKVVLLDHNREPYLNDNAIAFRVRCTFGEPAPQRRPALTAVDNGGVTR